MACAGHMLSAFLLSACEPPAHRSAGHWPAAQAALPLEALLMEAICLQAALPSQAMRAITRATYDPCVEVPRQLHRPARERVFIRMVIPAMRAQTCRAFLFVLPYGVDAQRVQ